MADAGAADIAPLPPMDREELKTILLGPNAAAFAAQPEWEGRPRETTPLSRVLDHGLVASVKDRYGYGLLARMVACLIELAEIPGRMHSLAATLKPERQEAQPTMPRKSGTGIGIAEAARGRLVHAVEIADGLVRRYRILAPTEWNFHPDGAAACGLARIALAAPQHREMLARLFIAAVNPCVGYELRLS
jgi:coenzyme F420-reducing hydrogenase alpha subunit